MSDFTMVINPPVQLVTTLTSGQGPAGINGASSSSYNHDQMIASALWTVNHGLGKYPSVTVIDSSGANVEGDVTYVNLNQLTIGFSAAFGGHAYIN